MIGEMLRDSRLDLRTSLSNAARLFVCVAWDKLRKTIAFWLFGFRSPMAMNILRVSPAMA